jgi:hypothetical protein
MLERRAVLLVVFAFLGMGAVSCGSSPTPSPVPSATPLPSPTLDPTITPTPTPVSLQAPGWEGAKVETLCLEVEQAYSLLGSDIEGKGPEPVHEVVERVLSGVGVELAGDECQCDATLSITITGSSLYAHYFGYGRCYNGAAVDAELLLSAQRREPLTITTEATVHPPDMIYGCHEEASDTPFHSVWPEALFDGLNQLWGPQVLIQPLGDGWLYARLAAFNALVEMGAEAVPALVHGLDHQGFRVRSESARALGRIGPDAIEAVPALIQAMEAEYYVDREDLVEALKDITGEDLGNLPGPWQEWWEDQR